MFNYPFTDTIVTNIFVMSAKIQLTFYFVFVFFIVEIRKIFLYLSKLFCSVFNWSYPALVEYLGLGFQACD